MRKAIRWAIIMACSLGIGYGLAGLAMKYESVAIVLSIVGTLTVAVGVIIALAWVLLEDDEKEAEEEREDVE